MLRRYRSDPSHVLKDSEVQVYENLTYVEEPMTIVDHIVKQLRKRSIPMVKVIWKNHGIIEATWETEEKMRRNYPHLFPDSGNQILRPKFLKRGENCNILALRNPRSYLHAYIMSKTLVLHVFMVASHALHV